MSWHENAPCRSVDGDLWFPDIGDNGEQAKRICRTCLYKAPCITEAIGRGEKHGIYAGISIKKAAAVRREIRGAA